MTEHRGDLWVFGYGSLMWRPGFDFVERVPALIRGAHRKLCVYSFSHRGTPERPGLVLGLDRGGSCHGIAFRVDPHRHKETIAYLREREQITFVYKEAVRPVFLRDGRLVPALCYLVDRKHRQYASGLSREDLLRLVQQGVGKSGANPDYVHNTVSALKDLGIHDSTLVWISERL